MNASHPRESLSDWFDSVERLNFSSLNHDLDVDVCVIGGGISGLTTAYLLLLEGKKVCVLESFEIGSGQTGRTSAHLSSALDDRYYILEQYFDREGAFLAADSHKQAIRTIAKIIYNEKIDCEFEFLNGYLFADHGQDEEILKKEFEAARWAGLADLSLTQILPIPHFEKRPNLCFPHQAQFHPLKYLNGLAKAIEKMGGKIFTQTHAEAIKGGAAPFVKTREGFRIDCKALVVATNAPINDQFAMHTKQSAYRSYVMAFKIPADSMERALYWDLAEPYHYARLHGSNVLIVGGEDHKTGQDDKPEERFKKLEQWTRRVFSMSGEVLYKWSGQILEPVDYLAYLGRNPGDENVYIITGDSGHGLTHGTIGGLLITDQIMNRRNKWQHIYDPSRVSLRATPRYLKENLNTAAQYADWIIPKHPDAVSELERGQGGVYRQGLQMVAVYKNDFGNLQTVSAVCTHLGGIVRWNGVEKSWDCPCHGSRFDVQGQVLEGPAIKALAPAELEIPSQSDDPHAYDRPLMPTIP